MDARSRLRAAALEVGKGENLQVLATMPMRQHRAGIGWSMLSEVAPQLVHLRERVFPVIVLAPGGLRPLALERHRPEGRRRNADQLGDLFGLEGPERLGGLRRVELTTDRLKAAGQGLRMAHDLVDRILTVVLVIEKKSLARHRFLLTPYRPYIGLQGVRSSHESRVRSIGFRWKIPNRLRRSRTAE